MRRIGFLSRIKTIILSPIPSPFGKSTLYVTDILPFFLYFIYINIDIAALSGLQRTGKLILYASVLLLFALPVIDLWPKAFQPPEEDPTSDPKSVAFRNRCRWEIFERLFGVVLAIFVLLSIVQ